MKKKSKGIIDITTFNIIVVKKYQEFDDFNKDIVKADLEEAANISNLKGNDGGQINFEFQEEKNEKVSNIDIKKFVFKMTNFEGVHFSDSFKTSPANLQENFKAWSKFWSRLSKIGYSIK